MAVVNIKPFKSLFSYPKNHQGRYVIYIVAGTYEEHVRVDGKKQDVLMYGDESSKTVVTGRKNFGKDRVNTVNIASFTTLGWGFVGTGPEGEQAVALRVGGDRSALYVHASRQFYHNCEISGTVDFIFGYSATLIQNSKIIVRKPRQGLRNIIVADGTPRKDEKSGIALEN